MVAGLDRHHRVERARVLLAGRRAASHAAGRQDAHRAGGRARARSRARPGPYRIKLKVANRDLYGADFVWVDEAQITSRADAAGRGGHRADRVGAPHRHDHRAAGGRAGDRERPGGLGRRSADACPTRPGCAPRSDESSARTSGPSTTRQEQVRLRLRRLELGGVTDGAEVEASAGARWRACRNATRSRRLGWPSFVAARRRASWWRPTAARRRCCRWPRSSTSTSRTGWASAPRAWHYVANVWDASRTTTRASRTPRAGCSRRSSAR